ncbi:MAG: CbiX/SirB N-terminal domain-containing protein [Candidatus Jordarchaeaceae archaeon]
MKKIGVVIAAHGDVPLDYDMGKAEEMMEKISEIVRKLPRNIDKINDPSKLETENLTKKLREQLGIPVEVGYAEFCSPSILETIKQLADKGIEKIIVVPLFFTHCRHTEIDIPEILEKAKQIVNMEIEYMDPLIEEMTEVLANKIRKTLKKLQNGGRKRVESLEKERGES